ncbi:MAG: hypothetical protein ACREQ5_04580 [Candidatus Dormibacteria bacterium]
MTEQGSPDAANPAEAPGVPASTAVTIETLHAQIAALFSLTSAMAAQTNWVCEQIQQFYASMPPFMRKGMNNNG